MSTRILIIAHAPLASALRDCAMHVFPDCAQAVVAIDVPPYEPPEDTLATAMQQLQSPQDTLVLTDVMGATPANVAQRLLVVQGARLIAGVNLPMLLRTVCYRQEPLEALVTRALSGASQGIMQVAITAPQNQPNRSHDSYSSDHQQ